MLLPLSVMAQEESYEHYEIAGAKLGRKINRQIRVTDFVRTPTTVTNTFGNGRYGYQRPLSFVGAMDGAVMGTLARNYKYQNYYHGPREFNYRKKAEYSNDISALEIQNVTYADDNNDGLLGKNETAQIYFDLINTGDTPLYGITPVVMANKTKHILVADPLPIDTLQAQSALRYVVELSGDGKRDPGKVFLLLRIKYGQQQYKDIVEIGLGTRKRKE